MKSRTVTGYFSAFGNVDSDGDMIMPGAYTKTIAENGPNGSQRIQHLLQHNTNQPLGKIKELTEDGYGLLFKSQLVPTSFGLDTILLYDAGVFNEHSVGFQTVKSQAKGNYKELQELRLWEGSTVTWGANADTPMTGLKGLNLSVDQIAEKFDQLLKGIKAGAFAGENEYLLDLSFSQFKDFFNDLNEQAEPQAKTKESEPLEFSNQAAKALDPQSVIRAIKELTAKIS